MSRLYKNIYEPISNAELQLRKHSFIIPYANDIKVLQEWTQF